VPADEDALITPLHVNTAQFPVWVTMARELADRLDAIPEEHAAATAKRLRAYADTFERWARDAVLRPPAEDRAPIISEYLSVYRQAQQTVTR
jgi:hypothetical protein